MSDLSVGEHHFVCTVATHCVRGMKVRVIVTEDDNSTTEYKVGVCNVLVLNTLLSLAFELHIICVVKPVSFCRFFWVKNFSILDKSRTMIFACHL